MKTKSALMKLASKGFTPQVESFGSRWIQTKRGNVVATVHTSETNPAECVLIHVYVGDALGVECHTIKSALDWAKKLEKFDLDFQRAEIESKLAENIGPWANQALRHGLAEIERREAGLDELEAQADLEAGQDEALRFAGLGLSVA